MKTTNSRVALLTPQEKDRIINKALEDIRFAAEISQYPSVLRAIITDKRVLEKLDDPVFFAVLLCGQQWLINADVHQKMLRDPSPRTVAVCGRGWGKSLVISLKAVCQYLFRYRKVDILIVSSSQRQSMQIFGYLENHILNNDILRSYVERQTRTLIKLKKPFESKVEALPCSPNRLRGKHPDILLVDEASFLPAEMVSSELIPMLSKPGARLIMLGTPWGWDHPFRTAFLSTKFSTYHAPSTSSPLVSQSQLAEWRELMTDDQWRREVEAQWIQPADSYFAQDIIRECVDPSLTLVDVDGSSPEEADGEYCLGADFGKAQDHSAVCIVEREEGDDHLKVVLLKEFPLGTNYTHVIGYIKTLSERFDISKGYVDQTGVGSPIVEEISSFAWDIEGITLTTKSKEEAISTLRLLLERTQISLPDDRILLAQIAEQKFSYSKTGRLIFTHPTARHDDLFWALTLSCLAATKVEPKAMPRAISF